jgi:ABC-type histidine transport system ATPase subunit
MKLLIWYPHVTVLENVIQCDVHAANLRYLAQANATNKL